MQLNTSQQQRVNQIMSFHIYNSLFGFAPLPLSKVGLLIGYNNSCNSEALIVMYSPVMVSRTLLPIAILVQAPSLPFVAISMLYLLMHRGGMLTPLLLR